MRGAHPSERLHELSQGRGPAAGTEAEAEQAGPKQKAPKTVTSSFPPGAGIRSVPAPAPRLLHAIMLLDFVTLTPETPGFAAGRFRTG